MKKTILVTIALLCGLMLFGQGKVKTRKYLLSDFTDKITKVVLPGNGILESARSDWFRRVFPPAFPAAAFHVSIFILVLPSFLNKSYDFCCKLCYNTIRVPSRVPEGEYLPAEPYRGMNKKAEYIYADTY